MRAPSYVFLPLLLTLLGAAVLNGAEPAEGMLIDFEKSDAFKTAGSQATAEWVNSGDGKALRITTQAEADYPSVTLTSPDGPWDLRKYDGVQIDIVNPQDVAVRVLLSVNNPGADGRKNSNVEGIQVAPRGRATFVLPFGTWHGNPTQLDLSKIVSVAVLLDKPGRAHQFVIDNLRAIKLDRSAMQEVFASEFFQQLKAPFGRGVNLGNALEAPREGDWGVTLQESYFDEIAKAGFDHVRIPVRWSAHAGRQAPYTIDPRFFLRVDWAIEQALKRGLKVVLNVHHYDEIFQEPDAHRERFVALWRQIAARYRARPATLAFELLNEPHNKLTADKWNALLVEALAEVRKTNPTRTVVVGPVAWNGIRELPSLVVPENDRNIVVTVHCYDPYVFTHQGADWLGDKAPPTGRAWQGTKEEQDAIIRSFDAAIRWGVENRRPIYLGEYGVYRRADEESRARWTRFLSEQAAERKMGSAYWEFCSGFGLYNAERGEYNVPLRDAVLISK